MSSYKFGQVTADSEQFYEAIDIDIKTLNDDNIVVSDPITNDKKRETPKIAYSHGV